MTRRHSGRYCQAQERRCHLVAKLPGHDRFEIMIRDVAEGDMVQLWTQDEFEANRAPWERWTATQ